MPNYRRVWVPGGTYFFTVNLHDRDGSLLVDHIDRMRVAFRVERAARPFDVVAMVVMPDHLHCIWRLPDDDTDYATRWRHIKSAFTRSLPHSRRRFGRPSDKSERDVWQRRFWERLLRDEHDLRTHVDYVHFNPVKHGLVERVCDWPHSTFHRYARDGQTAPDWGVSPRIC